jgi:hypothetical protein
MYADVASQNDFDLTYYMSLLEERMVHSVVKCGYFKVDWVTSRAKKDRTLCYRNSRTTKIEAACCVQRV